MNHLEAVITGELSDEVARLLPTGFGTEVDFEIVEQALKSSALQWMAKLV